MNNLENILKNAKQSSKKTALLSTEEKNSILLKLADVLEKKSDQIIVENKKDIVLAEQNNLGPMIDRLLLNKDRISAIAADVRNVASLHDFVGESFPPEKTPTGLHVQKVRFPLGVIAMIYESRPNVTIDASVLAFKSGNAIVLKGGKEAAYSNKILADIFREVLADASGALTNAVQLMENATREDTAELMKAKGKVDLLIPRGGKGLIDFVTKNAHVPTIETGASVVHTFVDESVNFEMALNIVMNSKTRRVAVCPTLDTLLVHKNIAENFLNQLTPLLKTKEVRIHTEETGVDFSTEWLDYDLAIKIVKNLDEALDHIDTYSLGHSESIVTENQENADRFLKEVDAACVYHNVSTAFSDGAQFGLGAEIGISTQKLHARGPFALEGLTTYKWIICGNGDIRS